MGEFYVLVFNDVLNGVMSLIPRRARIEEYNAYSFTRPKVGFIREETLAITEPLVMGSLNCTGEGSEYHFCIRIDMATMYKNYSLNDDRF